MKPLQAIILSVCAVVLIALALIYFVDWSPTKDALANKALKGSDPAARKQAVQELLLYKDRQNIHQLRKVAGESQDPDIKAMAMNGLFGDYASIDLFLDNMNDNSEEVREVAGQGAKQFFGGTLPEGIEFDATADSADRLKVAQRLKDILAKRRKEAEEEQKKWDAEAAKKAAPK